jgi:hypothetical protein
VRAHVALCVSNKWRVVCDIKLVCNRYRLTHSKQYVADRFQATGDEIEDRPRYNIAPTQAVLTVRKEEGSKVRKFTTMRWGLIPSWAKDMSIGNRTLNARSETVTTTPAFRDSILIKTLPHSWRWILRVAKNGICEATVLLRGW